MSLLTESEKRKQTATGEAIRREYRSDEELAIRDSLETFIRSLRPDARIVHELVMGRGTVRADVVAISPDWIDVFEIKGPYDESTRLMHQVGMYRLGAPDVWIVTAGEHEDDARLIKYLFPSIGQIRVHGVQRLHGLARRRDEAMANVTLEVLSEPTEFTVLPDAMLSILWASELAAEVKRHGLLEFSRSKPPTWATSLKAMLSLTWDEQLAAVCRQLRARDALWRADPPIIDETKP